MITQHVGIKNKKRLKRGGGKGEYVGRMKR